MKNIFLSIAILLVTAGLAAPSAMARTMRGGAISHRPSVEMRGPGHDNGVYYSSIGREYEVVRPQVGMIVPSLPMRHSVMMRNGSRHYIHNGVIYRPIHRNGNVTFRVVGFI